MTLYRDILKPFVPPLTEFSVVLTVGRKDKVMIKVLTRKLHDAPYYVFSAYAPEFVQPILELISWPAKDHLADAYATAVEHGQPVAPKGK